MGEIFLIQDGHTLVPLAQRPYESESLLQTLLAKYPSLLAGDQVNPEAPRKWLLIRQEIPVPDAQDGSGRWSLDHLFLDQDGVPTLVEVKRSSDTRIRREVVGQMLDYAANAVKHWPADFIRIEFEKVCAAKGADPSEEIRGFLGVDQDPDQFWITVRTNLKAGRVRLLFVADEIPDELRRVVEFLNEQMDSAEVLAIEIRQFAGPSVQTLVPRVIGQTAEAESRKGGSGSASKRQWDESTFFAEMLSRHGAPTTDVARQILQWARAHVSRVWWGRGSTNGSFVPVQEVGDDNHQLFAVYTGGAKGQASLEIYFYWYTSKPPFDNPDKRREMLRMLNDIPGIKLPESAIDKRPNIPLTTLAEEAVRARFLKVMEWYLEQVNKKTAV